MPMPWMSWPKKKTMPGKLQEKSLGDERNGGKIVAQTRRRRKRTVMSSSCCKGTDVKPSQRSVSSSIGSSSNSTRPLHGAGNSRVMHRAESPLVEATTTATASFGRHSPLPQTHPHSHPHPHPHPQQLLDVAMTPPASASGRLSFSEVDPVAVAAAALASPSGGVRSLVQLTRLSGCYNAECSMVSSPCDGSLFPRGIASPCVGDGQAAPQTSCSGCGSHFRRREAFDDHYCAHHTVTELKEGDSARKIVEIIFQTSWLNMETPYGKIDRILKVNNSPQAIKSFEEYRNTIKAKASRLMRKHPRCMADGNELLRFHCTSITCRLGARAASSSLCSLPCCHLCAILRSGFPPSHSQMGIYTTASSGKAHNSSLDYIPELAAGVPSPLREEKKAMIVCRVIAGRVKKLFQEEEDEQEQEREEEGGGGDSSSPSLSSSSSSLSAQEGAQVGYDSVAGAAGTYTNLDELLVYNPTAVLPCFVIIYGA